VNSELQSA